ncbi:uncharacterized protein [Anomalospiza imberbis]|uniref:uncharacterized protein n=1 Tax=Anomalospiza imberbis TaxID=187417 RepID=UPI00358E807A
MREIRSSSVHSCCRQAQGLLLVWGSNCQPVPSWPPPAEARPRYPGDQEDADAGLPSYFAPDYHRRTSPAAQTPSDLISELSVLPFLTAKLLYGMQRLEFLPRLLKHTNTRACTGRALKREELLQLSSHRKAVLLKGTAKALPRAPLKT